MTDHELLSSLSDMMDSKLSPIKSDIGILKEEVSGLRKDVDILKEDVGTLKTEVKELRKDVDILKEDVGTLKTEVKELRKDVDTLKGDVNTLKEDVDTLKEDVGTLKEDVETLNTESWILKKGIRILNLKMENDLSPRLQNIEECYISTFYRYRDGIVQTEQMQADIEVLKSVVKDHSKTIQRFLIP